MRYTQRVMAKWLTEEHNGDYVLTVKKNQPNLYRDVKALFEGSFPPHHVTVDRAHGRDEIRTITVTAHVASLDFPGVYQAWRIQRDRPSSAACAAPQRLSTASPA